MAEPFPEIEMKEQIKEEPKEEPKQNLNIFDSEIYNNFIKLLDNKLLEIKEKNKIYDEYFDYVNNLKTEYYKNIDKKTDEFLKDKQEYLNLTKEEKRDNFIYILDEMNKYFDMDKDYKSNEYNKKQKELLYKIRVIFDTTDRIQGEEDFFYSLDEIFSNFVYAGEEEEINILRGQKKLIKKLKKTDLPELKNALISEIERKAIDQKKVWFSALVEYIKSGDFRKEIFMPLIILVVGLLGTDTLKPILNKIGIATDSGDIKELTKYIKNQTENTEKLINELEDIKYMDNQIIPKNNNKHIKKLLGHRVGL